MEAYFKLLLESGTVENIDQLRQYFEEAEALGAPKIAEEKQDWYEIVAAAEKAIGDYSS